LQRDRLEREKNRKGAAARGDAEHDQKVAKEGRGYEYLKLREKNSCAGSGGHKEGAPGWRGKTERVNARRRETFHPVHDLRGGESERETRTNAN